MPAIQIRPRSKRSRFVAIDLIDRRTVIAEGVTAKSVAKKAEKTGKQFSMMFVPRRDATYVL